MVTYFGCVLLIVVVCEFCLPSSKNIMENDVLKRVGTVLHLHWGDVNGRGSENRTSLGATFQPFSVDKPSPFETPRYLHLTTRWRRRWWSWSLWVWSMLTWSQRTSCWWIHSDSPTGSRSSTLALPATSPRLCVPPTCSPATTGECLTVSWEAQA